jgi:hypothetical protein
MSETPAPYRVDTRTPPAPESIEARVDRLLAGGPPHPAGPTYRRWLIELLTELVTERETEVLRTAGAYVDAVDRVASGRELFEALTALREAVRRARDATP